MTRASPISKLMQPDLDRIMNIEVPIIVRLGERMMSLGDVLALAPGTIIELPNHSDDKLTLCVNNKAVGRGSAVKVGENFGICISSIGDLADRVEAMGPETPEEDTAAATAEALLAAQL